MSKKKLYDEEGNIVKGAKVKKPFYKRWWFIAFVVVIVIGAISGGDEGAPTEVAVDETDQVEEVADAEVVEDAEAEEVVENESEEAVTEEPVEEVEEESEESITLEPITLTGSGDLVTDTFELISPYAVINSSDDGSSNFIVRLNSSEGADTLVNEIGPYSGNQFKAYPPGEYRLEVQSEGNWEITFDPNIPIEGQKSPLSGSGDQVVFLDIESGSYVLNASDDGTSNFIVRVNDSRTLVNEIGPYDGQSIANIDDTGIYAISVQSEGNWVLDFTE